MTDSSSVLPADVKFSGILLDVVEGDAHNFLRAGQGVGLHLDAAQVLLLMVFECPTGSVCLLTMSIHLLADGRVKMV